jgi:hypothetical protein
VVRPARSISPKAVLHLAIQGPKALEMKATTNGSTPLHLHMARRQVYGGRRHCRREGRSPSQNRQKRDEPTTSHDRL